MAKKLFVLLFCVFMIGFTAFAVGAEETSGQCGNDVIWEYDTSSATLTISGNGAMYNFTDSDPAPWDTYRNSSKEVVIEDGVTTIGDDSFSDCENLQSIDFGNTVTSIGDSAFYYCGYYFPDRITIPDSVTEIGSYAFYETYVYATIPATVKSIGRYAFDAGIETYVKYLGTEQQWRDMNVISGSYLAISIPADDVTIGYCGAYKSEQSVEWRFECSKGIFTIRGQGKMAGYDYYMCDMPWRSYNIVTVIIEEGVTSIGSNTFMTNHVIKEVYLPVSLKIIEYSVFCEEHDIISYYPGTVEQWESIEIGSFNEALRAPKFVPLVTSNGVIITVSNLGNIRDFYIAKGEYDSYIEMKEGGYIVRVSSEKLGNNHSYVYPVKEAGVHTIIVRYNDDSMDFFYEELSVEEPTFETDGMQITVGNIPDVKVIRTAYGEWNSTKELRTSDTARSFTAKNDINGTDEYTVCYREEGTVTVIVEYNNGYVKIFHAEITKKAPVMEQEGNVVTFSELDGLKVLRCAEGEYNTSADIKYAQGCVNYRPAEITDGKITVELEPGTYSFCVQYNDGSFNYYIVTVG